MQTFMSENADCQVFMLIQWLQYLWNNKYDQRCRLLHAYLGLVTHNTKVRDSQETSIYRSATTTPLFPLKHS